MNYSFNDRFFDLCNDKDVNIIEVAKSTGIQEKTLYKICERNKYPSFEIVVLLCNYFDCSIDYLLGLTEAVEKDFVYTTSNFIKNYRKFLENNNISLYRMYKDKGIGLSRIYNWGEGNLPYVTTLITIAKYFNITVHDLISPKY